MFFLGQILASDLLSLFINIRRLFNAKDTIVVKEQYYMERKENIENFRTFFVWSVSYLKKKRHDKSKISWLALLFKHIHVKIQPYMSEQEKKRQRNYDLLNAETKSKFICLLYKKQSKEIFLQKKSFFMKRRSKGLNRKLK